MFHRYRAFSPAEGYLLTEKVPDALGLPGKGVELLEIPLSPKRLWELVTKRQT